MKPTEFEHLLALILENEATAEESALLLKALENDPALLKEAKLQMELHGQLGVALESEFSTEQFISNTSAKIETDDKNQFSDKVVKKINTRIWLKRSMALAALVLVGFTTIFMMQKFSSNNNTPENQLAVASVTRLDGVKWSSGSCIEGDPIIAGQSISISSGLLEVDLEGRGKLLIEGPAHLDFTSPMEAVLHRGSLVMRATEKGHGYTVKTSQGSVVDLGTEFAVSVGENDVVETHVIEGSVEAISNNGNSVTLKANDARRFDHSDGQSIAADTGRFYTAMPPIHQHTKSIHWNFNENKGLLARSSGQLGENSTQSNDLVFNAIEEGVPPRWIQGVNKSGVYFDGKGGFAQSEYKGIEGGQARSVCCWVKVPKDFSTKEGFGIISWGDSKQLGGTWQISVNPLQSDGKLGRLRLGLHGGQIIGSTDLRDGKWHHIAVVLYGGSKPNVGTHALLYVDGQKEIVSRAALQEVKTKTANTDHGVWVGRNVTYRDNSQAHAHGKFFRGGIDELYIFDSALSQSEVQELMEQ